MSDFHKNKNKYFENMKFVFNGNNNFAIYKNKI